MEKTIKTVLLMALPASGKSEVRKYLDNLSTKECREHFHMGLTVQLDDFPYVHFMRRIDEELKALGQEYIYYHAPDKNFANPLVWGALIEILNQDYQDLINKPPLNPPSPARYMFWKLDMALSKVGGETLLNKLPVGIQDKLADKLDEEAGQMLKEKKAGIPDTLEEKTVVMEFARGGADGSKFPLEDPYGYQYSLRMLSEEILESAAILYIWVTPEESRRKNDDRTDPNDPGSILHHGVPMYVMMNDYGCDDMEYLLEQSDIANTVTVEAHGKTFHLPVGRVDNRNDLTTFLRGDPRTWDKAATEKLRTELNGAFSRLWEQYNK